MVEKMALFEPNDSKILWQETAQKVIGSCPKLKKEREREILSARFGIGENPKTLQAIGDKNSITRERVRQIVNNALSKIRKNCVDTELKALVGQLEAAITSNGGYSSNDFLASMLTDGSKTEANGLIFVASLAPKLENVKISNIFFEGWRLKNIKLADLKLISSEAIDLLKDKKNILSLAEISQAQGKEEKRVNAALSANKQLMQDDQGNWGLTKWPHVNPRSIRDRSKYIMVRHGKPLHYEDLTKKIVESGNKDVTKQSVHNELIKNTDFVLVGRGIYALADWGYTPGIVEEVIVMVLEEAGGPLHREVIVERVLERRIVKPGTVILNLQRPRFKKIGKAVYTLN